MSLMLVNLLFNKKDKPHSLDLQQTVIGDHGEERKGGWRSIKEEGTRDSHPGIPGLDSYSNKVSKRVSRSLTFHCAK